MPRTPPLSSEDSTYGTRSPSPSTLMPPPPCPTPRYQPQRHDPKSQARTLMEFSTRKAEVITFIRSIKPSNPAEQNFVDMMENVATELKDELKWLYWERGWRQKDNFSAELKIVGGHIGVFEDAARGFREGRGMKVGWLDAGSWSMGMRVLGRELLERMGG